MGSYPNCMYPQLTLENYGTSSCPKKIHHICQQNIDELQYNGEFERVFGLQFCCSEYVVDLKNKSLFSSSEDSECKSDEEK